MITLSLIIFIKSDLFLYVCGNLIKNYDLELIEPLKCGQHVDLLPSEKHEKKEKKNTTQDRSRGFTLELAQCQFVDQTGPNCLSHTHHRFAHRSCNGRNRRTRTERVSWSFI